jgi:predicted CXXCH cytochrome family protein
MSAMTSPSIGRRVLLALLAAALAWPAAHAALQGGGPLPWGTKAASSHAPYASGDCTLCHSRRADGYAGPLLETGDAPCLACHEEARRHLHAPRKCVACHNAHDALRSKLLRADLDACSECHRK